MNQAVVTSGRGGGGGCGGGGGAVKGLEEYLSLPILLAERVAKAVCEAESFKSECAEVGKKVDQVASHLRSAVRLVTSSPSPFYDRPFRRILAEACRCLERVLALVARCRRAGGFLRRVVTITTSAAEFRRALAVLDSSVADLRWLLAVYSDEDGGGGGAVIGLPPIASTDPIISLVWSYVATVQSASRSATDREEAALGLDNLALDNDRNKKIILEEGGVPPLLFLLRLGPSCESQVAATTALSNLASSSECVAMLLKELAVPIVVHVLSDFNSPTRLRTVVAGLVARMASHLPLAQEEFASENAIRPLVSLLSYDVPLDDPQPVPKKPSSIHSLVQGIASGGNSKLNNSSSCSSKGSSSSLSSSLRNYYHHNHRKEWDNESPEAKFALKVACAEALWKLSKGCLSNCRKITETKALLCLSKIIEREKGDLQHHCLMTLMEIATAAEVDADLRRSAFKMNSPAAKSVVEQLMKVAQQGSSPVLQIASTKAIGCLARTFPAKEAKILSPLVFQLGNWNPDVAAEAARALAKFASPENFLCLEHSKAIAEFAAVPVLMSLIRSGDRAQLPAVTLVCYLALHIPNSEALERAKVLTSLQLLAKTPQAQDPSLRELLPKAIYQLELYQFGSHIARQPREL